MDRKVKNWLCRDKRVKDAIKEGKDVYSFIASILYGIDYSDCCEFYPDNQTNIEGQKRRKIAKYLICAAYFGDLDYLETVRNIVIGNIV